ncbi:MAG TPA: M28 family peptidase [Solirubrobacteraceae bacterium]
MRAAETATALTEFDQRGGGTDAERRAALWLAREVRSPRRAVYLETFWHRPNWALAHAWHCLIAVVGGLVMVSHAAVGGAVVLVALISVLADWLTGRSIGRRLTRERASQNVVSPAPAATARTAPAAATAPTAPSGNTAPTAPGGTTAPAVAPAPDVRLIVTANYDAGRAGLGHRTPVRSAGAGIKRLAGAGRFTPGWMGWLVIELLWLLAVAVVRDGGTSGTPIKIALLIPVASLVLEAALLLDLGSAPFGPAAGDNAAGTAVAIALVRALDAAPPRRLGVDLLLQGSGENGMIGLRRHLRRRGPERRAANTVVLGIAACGGGRPCWWVSDGAMVPLRYLARLRDLAARTGGPDTPLKATPHFGRGTGPALPARTAGIPALTIGAVDARGLAPRSHQAGDRAQSLDPAALDTVLEFALTLVDAIDADLARAARARDPDRARAADGGH